MSVHHPASGSRTPSRAWARRSVAVANLLSLALAVGVAAGGWATVRHPARAAAAPAVPVTSGRLTDLLGFPVGRTVPALPTLPSLPDPTAEPAQAGAAPAGSEAALNLQLQLLMVTPFVPSRLTLSAPSAVTAGHPLELHAALVSATGLPVAEAPVTFYDRPAGTRVWRVLYRATTDPDGQAAIVMSYLPQTTLFRVGFAGLSDYAAAPARTALVHLHVPVLTQAQLLANLDRDSAAQLATLLLDNPNLEQNGFDVHADLVDTAAGLPGTSGAPLNPDLLRFLVVLSDSYSVSVTALESGGSGHCYAADGVSQSEATCPDDAHYLGHAVDIDALDGEAVTGRNAAALAVMAVAVRVLPPGSGFGQSNCGPTPQLPPGWSTFPDACTHLHIQV